MTFLSKEILPIPGIELGSACAGIKKPDRRDLVLVRIPERATCAAVFTQNRFCAAPVQVAKNHLSQYKPRCLIINTGYANAGLGEQGLNDAIACCKALAEQVAVNQTAVLPFSTGVIGEPLPVQRVVQGFEACINSLSERAQAWHYAAEGIMTTDTRPKLISASTHEGVCVTGMSKGAGMICPNMATMLGFVAVNQPVEKELAQRWLRTLVDDSFNAITVDGDTSTNDAAVLICCGDEALSPIVNEDDPRASGVYQALQAVFRYLAQAIVRDAEGATKFVRIKVSGANARSDCETVARVIAHSPLVKTALFASDPNWGRILAAIGRAPIDAFDIETVSISLNGFPFVSQGRRVERYDESALSEIMLSTDLELDVSMGNSQHSATIWTSDLSQDYVKINAEYRT